jgi:beta-mannosidase
MLKISLDGEWKLNWCNVGTPLIPAEKVDFDDSTWLKAQVPGVVHLDLMAAGIIPDPYFGKNVYNCQWIEDKEWWYRRSFEIPVEFRKDKVELVFEGLDTFASIYLNGELIARHENMFTPCKIDVTRKLNYGGKNILAVRLDSPLRGTLCRVRDYNFARQASFHLWSDPFRVYVRRVACNWGWDWAPRLVTVGIWRSVYLRAIDNVAIRDVFVTATPGENGKASIEIQVLIENCTQKSIVANMKIEAKCKESMLEDNFQVDLKTGEQTIIKKYILSNAKLWWPNGVGEQNLYSLKVTIKKEDRTLDEYSTRFGIRKVELVTKADDTPSGNVFYFKINGEKIFCKGANFGMLDLLYPRAKEEKYKKALQMAKDANYNMWRLNGVGIPIEYDVFYDLCDEMGIMIWQDFPFSCAQYPQDEEFLKTVEEEAKYIIKHLRNHPSIVLWCGNNECEAFEQHNKIFHDLLPKICKELDPTRPYWPSSPFGGEYPYVYNSPEKGDRHSWWPGYEYYYGDEAKFVSEFGFQAPPAVETLKSFIMDESEIWPITSHKSVWLYRFYRPDLTWVYLEKDYGLLGGWWTRSLEDYVRLAQLVQADNHKVAIEYFRRRKFQCGGTLFWSFVDPWPSATWSVVDYYLIPKIAYYYGKRAYSPVLLSFYNEGEIVSIWVTNDKFEELTSEIEIKHMSFTGNIYWEKKMNVKIPPNSSKKILEINLKELHHENITNEYLYGKIEVDHKILSDNIFFFVKHKELAFPRAKLEIKVSDREINDLGEYKLRIICSSDFYARLVELKVLPVFLNQTPLYSDNFFDIQPKETKEVEIKGKLPDGQREISLAVYSLNAETPKPIKISFK